MNLQGYFIGIAPGIETGQTGISDLFVQQVLLAKLLEFLQAVLPVLCNASWVMTLRDRVEDRLVRQDFDHAIHLEVLRIKLAYGCSELDSKLGSVEIIAAQQNDVYAFTFLARIRARRGRKRNRKEAHARNASFIEIARELASLDPGRSDQLKWRVSPAPYREICSFDQGHTRV
jgi:hypothetical protein